MACMIDSVVTADELCTDVAATGLYHRLSSYKHYIVA